MKKLLVIALLMAGMVSVASAAEVSVVPSVSSYFREDVKDSISAGADVTVAGLIPAVPALELTTGLSKSTGEIESLPQRVDLDILDWKFEAGYRFATPVEGLSVTPVLSADALFMDAEDAYKADNDIAVGLGAKVGYKLNERTELVARAGYQWAETEINVPGKVKEVDLEGGMLSLGVAIAI